MTQILILSFKSPHTENNPIEVQAGNAGCERLPPTIFHDDKTSGNVFERTQRQPNCIWPGPQVHRWSKTILGQCLLCSERWPTSCIAVEKMKSYSEIDTALEVSVHQDLGKKKRVSRVVFGAGVFLIAAICGFALLTAIGQSQPCQIVVVILARIIIRIAWIFTITELMCFYFSFWHYLRRRFWLHAQF